ncbi:cellulose synthase/poly-beta-1,6-N-acetylglucosamine synthase-like glycosyltransferase [Bacteroides zoogleoformans]|uniref:Glycosyl transferase family 2 n=1 Tax=Bacteroides zoogleoformans TaxID=28119 RepID=A0ABM6TB44_9BACE|nr:glycosyltransferase [Bacteroides zoogleoformans]AVM53972.1 glycosyl transferase family 2 [Bacteroides zoogleoformans]TWJ11204.1 cellulose synthase/poly-beta-1,6-N-acetylglucosamine synthase-like glycosyltransferase [Bacteroides zoogleoformans]
MEAFTLENSEKILLVAISVLFIIQTLYYFCLYNRIHSRNRAVKQGDTHFAQALPPVSIIICAHDEAENLRDNLSAVLEQDYPQYEVIVINDGNTDESKDYLTLLEEKYPHLYHSFVPASSRYISRKKLAATLGIKASKYDWVVFTDANCRPQSNQWLRLLARNFTPRTQVVLGYSGYERGKGWLHKQVSFDNLFTSMRYLGFALAGSPYMGIGRNLAYRKELFYQQKGFAAHLNLQRGDDDLFINRIATADNTRIETDADAIVRMQPVRRAKDWREEKIGYTSTSYLYHGMQRWLAGGETFTRLAFHATWITLLIVGILHANRPAAGIAFTLFLLRFIVQAIIINQTAKDLKEKRRYYFTLPLFDLLQPMQSMRWKLYCLLRKKSNFLRK